MKTIIENSKYLSLLAVITLLLTFALSLVWGIAQAVKAWSNIILSWGQSPDIIVSILKLIDAFLVAMVLYILAASLYELFVGKLELSSKLVARSLTELKSKLSSVIVLVLAVHAVEVIFDEGITGLEMVWQVVAISLISFVLIAFSHLGISHESTDS
ncbi:MAG: hypothetical protein DCC55_40590 [Chloroflexi bacterium]|nr:MAG: hypothetical protein DCC55_40590 [Chloroflexota bacterium]